jgi:hypothetical protein
VTVLARIVRAAPSANSRCFAPTLWNFSVDTYVEYCLDNVQRGGSTMKRLGAAVAMALVVVIGTAAQGSLTGIWQGETRAGSRLVLDLTAKDDTLTGTLTRDEQTSAISEGKVSKTAFTFKAKLNDQIEGFSGELAGDEIKVWLDRQGAERAIVLKRATRK